MYLYDPIPWSGKFAKTPANGTLGKAGQKPRNLKKRAKARQWLTTFNRRRFLDF